MKALRNIGFWLLLIALFALAVRLERGFGRSEQIKAASGEAVRVIDGDSLRIADREIRLAGIDAPEYRQTCLDEAGRAWPCGKEARTALEQMLAEGKLSCTKKAGDRYGRALAHCRTQRGDVASRLAGLGWALDARDERFEAPVEAISQARSAKRGIWRGRHQHPAEWRKANARPAP
jgi:endonuclease YncB( thermonuclease family)